MDTQQILPQSQLISQQQQASTFPEDTNVKFIYNLTPGNQDLATKCAIPNAVHYTPFDEDTTVQKLSNIQGIICARCFACINKYCQVNEDKKLWICVICGQYNKLSPNLPQIYRTSNNYELDLLTHINSQNQPKKRFQNIYLFVVDLCITEKQLQAIKVSIIDFVSQKIKNEEFLEHTEIRIGLITFSKFVYFYELNSNINTVVSISPKKAYQHEELSVLLGLPPEDSYNSSNRKYMDLCKKYLFRLNNKKAQERFINRIKKLRGEGDINLSSRPQGKRTRPLRASGQALNICLSLAEIIPFHTRIISCSGGPCTHGVGKIIGVDFNEQFRSISEADNISDQLPYFDAARKFYIKLKEKIIARGTIVDLFIFSLEQIGITEMYQLIRVSGGYLVLGEEFSSNNQIFQNSFRKAYISVDSANSEENTENYSLSDLSGTSTIISLLCSRDIVINGALGQCHPLKNFKHASNQMKTSGFFSQKNCGFGKTSTWHLGGIDMYRSITFAYQLANQKALDKCYYIQFKTFYTDCYGRKILRVTTACRSWQDNLTSIKRSFDQEAAILFLARWYIYRQIYDIKRNNKLWIDKLLISWTQVFAQYIKNDPKSFKLSQNMKYLPQFVYNFRRNPIFRRNGISLDQLYYHMHCLNRYTISKCLSIIQPALLSYSVENLEPKPVQLAEKQMKQTVILLLDTFFNVVVWYGQSIKYWQQQQFHKKQQYQHIKKLLLAPQQDIQYLLNSRFPYPGFFKTYPNHSKERFLKSKVSPIKQEENQNLVTDDASLQSFTKALIEIVVKFKGK